MENAKNALLEVIRQFEAQSSGLKVKYDNIYHLNVELQRMSIPAIYNDPIQQLLDQQDNVLSISRMVFFKSALKQILNTLANYNPEVNGFAKEVGQILMNDIGHDVTAADILEQLMGTEEVGGGHLPEELDDSEGKVDTDQDESEGGSSSGTNSDNLDQSSIDKDLQLSAEGTRSPVASSNDSQHSSTPGSNDEEIISQEAQLLQLLSTHVLEVNDNKMAQQSENIEKEPIGKKLSLQPEDNPTNDDFDEDEVDDLSDSNSEGNVQPEDNPINQDTDEDDNLSENVAANSEGKFEDKDQDSSDDGPSSVANSDDHTLNQQPSPSSMSIDKGSDDVLSPWCLHSDGSQQSLIPFSHSNDEAMIQEVNQLPQLVSTEHNDNKMAQQHENIEKEPMLKKKLTLQPEDNQDTDEDDDEDDLSKNVAANSEGKFEDKDQYSSDGPENIEKEPMPKKLSLQPEDNPTDSDDEEVDDEDDLSDSNSEGNAQPMEQKQVSTDLNIQSPDAHSDEYLNIGPVVAEEPSTLSKTKKRSFPQARINDDSNNEVADQGQSNSDVKKAKLDSTQSGNSPSQATNQSEENNPIEAQVNKLPPMVIPLGIKCFKLDCGQMLPNVIELNAHMWDEHHVRAYPCLLKDCGQSFDDSRIRFQHIEKDHYSVREWHCAQCPKEFNQYVHLSNHCITSHFHQYQCAFVNCEFTSGFKWTISEHYVYKHLTCGHFLCGRHFRDLSTLAQHEQTHMPI